METKVVNLRKEVYDIYIGRGSKWGNPFRIGTDGTRNVVIRKYEEYVRSNEELMNSLGELENKILGCYCVKGQHCHGEVLIRLLKEKHVEVEIKKEENKPKEIVKNRLW